MSLPLCFLRETVIHNIQILLGWFQFSLFSVDCLSHMTMQTGLLMFGGEHSGFCPSPGICLQEERLMAPLITGTTRWVVRSKHASVSSSEVGLRESLCSLVAKINSIIETLQASNSLAITHSHCKLNMHGFIMVKI